MKVDGRFSRIYGTWSARVLLGGLVSAFLSAFWFLSLSPALFFLGQGLGLGTSIAFLRRRPERDPAAGVGFALAVFAVLAPDFFWFLFSQTHWD